MKESMTKEQWHKTYGWQEHNHTYWPADFKFLWPNGDKLLHGDIPTLAHLDEFVFPLVPEKRVAVQAGGAMGMWAKRMAQEFGVVYTFEPNPQSFYCCSFNCPEENVVPFHAALGAEPALIKVSTPHREQNYGANRVTGAGHVPVMTIDSLELEHCDLLMLDIEGYELFALQGALETIKRCKPVIVLEDKGCSTEFGYQKGRVERFLQRKAKYRTHSRFHGDRDVILCPE